jgi:signal transduction histidine kinase
MGAAALVAPVLLVVEHLQGTPIEAAAVAGGWAALFVLVAARVVGLVRDIEQAETERRSLFDRTLQASEEERIQVAGEPHDGPIQRLTALVYELENAKQRLLRDGQREGAARLDQAQAARSAEAQGLRQLMVSLRPRRWTRSRGGRPPRRRVGFRPVPSSVLVRDGRFGLAGMRERVEMAGGRLQVDGRPGGVTLRASFAVPSAA